MGKVEFTGVLPWPATAKTDAQRRALMRRRYAVKLTDLSPAEIGKRKKSPGLSQEAGAVRI